MKKLIKAIHNYLSDWKNLLVHTLTGIAMLLIIFVIPLPSYVRIIVFLAVVAFNIYRGKKAKPKASLQK